MPKLPISFWESIIRKGIEEGLSGHQILKRAREEGLKIRTKTFYDIYNEVKSSLDFEDIIKSIPETKKIPDRLLARTTKRIPTKYQYIVEVDHDIGTSRFGIYTDYPLSPYEIKEEAKFMAIREYELLDIKAIRILRAVKRK